MGFVAREIRAAYHDMANTTHEIRALRHEMTDHAVKMGVVTARCELHIVIWRSWVPRWRSQTLRWGSRRRDVSDTS